MQKSSLAVITILPLLVLLMLAGCTSQEKGPTNQSIINSTNNSGTITNEKNTSNSLNATNVDYASPKPSYKFDFTARYDENKQPIVYYFYEPGCSACKLVRNKITELETRYNGSTVWKEYDITTVDGAMAYKEFTLQYNLSVKQMYVPQILINGTIITGVDPITKTLETSIVKLK